MEFALLTQLDMCKRSVGTIVSSNIVCIHIVIGVALGSIKKDKQLYDAAAKAFVEFNKANMRPDPVSLTTGEYAALKKFVGHYQRILRFTTWKEYVQAEEYSFKRGSVEDEIREEYREMVRKPYHTEETTPTAVTYSKEEQCISQITNLSSPSMLR